MTIMIKTITWKATFNKGGAIIAPPSLGKGGVIWLTI